MRSKVWLIILSLFLLSGCKTEEHFSNFPFAPVNFMIDLNGLDSDLHELSYKIFHQGRFFQEHVGLGGLLVFRNTAGEIIAFDLSCPHEASKEIRVKPNDFWKAECPACGSSFDMLNGLGSPVSGPSKSYLKKYNASPNFHQKGQYLIKN